MIGSRDKDTICAVSTPHGVGGISVIRVSGLKAVQISRLFCPFLPENPTSHKAYYGLFMDPATKRALDEVILTFFEEGRSFTGENTVEIACHGNPVICKDLLDRLVEGGSRPADRGEFTYRAFMNNRLDLIQAESVLSLIESRSSEAARMSLRQLQGDLSKRITSLEDDLIWCLAHIEAGIDFSTEGLDVVDLSVMDRRLAKAAAELESLVDSFRQGRVLKDGFKIVFAGRPNVGKSSLLNLFLESERAIVTDIAGTTRDVVEGEILFAGQRLVFLDTAGLRDATDQVERYGIERSYQAQADADLVLFVFDESQGFRPEDQVLLEKLDPKRTLILGNKVDLSKDSGQAKSLRALKECYFFTAGGFNPAQMVFFVSALDKTTRQRILSEVKDRFLFDQTENVAVISSARHYERLGKALTNVQKSREMVASGDGSEFVAVELKESLLAVQEVLGKRFDDQVMDRVFKEFCIGK